MLRSRTPSEQHVGLVDALVGMVAAILLVAKRSPRGNQSTRTRGATSIENGFDILLYSKFVVFLILVTLDGCSFASFLVTFLIHVEAFLILVTLDGCSFASFLIPFLIHVEALRLHFA